MIKVSYDDPIQRYGERPYYHASVYRGYQLSYESFEELSSFIEDYKDLLHSNLWDIISSSYDIPIWFIRKYQDKLRWSLISPTIREVACLREFKDKIDWEAWCQARYFNDYEIIKEFAEYIYLYYPLEKVLSAEELEELKFKLLQKVKMPKRRIILDVICSEKVQESSVRRRMIF